MWFIFYSLVVLNHDDIGCDQEKNDFDMHDISHVTHKDQKVDQMITLLMLEAMRDHY